MQEGKAVPIRELDTGNVALLDKRRVVVVGWWQDKRIVLAFPECEPITSLLVPGEQVVAPIPGARVEVVVP